MMKNKILLILALIMLCNCRKRKVIYLYDYSYIKEIKLKKESVKIEPTETLRAIVFNNYLKYCSIEKDNRCPLK